jgi:hypothetical protein
MKRILYCLIVCLFFACKKESITSTNPEVNPCIIYDTLPSDTVYPIAYYPAYPGSFWTYEKDGVEETVQVENLWVETPVLMNSIDEGTCIRKYIKMTYLPKILNGNHIHFDQYIRTYSNTDGSFSFGSKILDTIVGNAYNNSSTGWVPNVGMTSYYFKNEEFFDVFDVDGQIYENVFHIRKHITYTDHYGSYNFEIDYYYARNIGLILEETTFLLTAQQGYRKVLTSYFINN